MEDRDHVGFDGESAGVAPLDGVPEDIVDSSIAIAGEGVIGIILFVVPSGVLDVDMDGMVTDGGPELPGILFGPGLW